MPSSPHSPDRQPTLSITDERERVLQVLSYHFAQDNLSLDELEARMERAYKSATVADLQELVADLPQTDTASGGAVAKVAAPPPVALPAERERILSLMSETKRVGPWGMPQRLEVLAVMSDTTIDLTQATLPDGIIDIHLRSMWAAVKIIVPPGLQVVNRLSSLMGSVSGGGEPEDESRGATAWRSNTVLRLTGWVLMAEVQTVVRRVE